MVIPIKAISNFLLKVTVELMLIVMNNNPFQAEMEIVQIIIHIIQEIQVICLINILMYIDLEYKG